MWIKGPTNYAIKIIVVVIYSLGVLFAPQFVCALNVVVHLTRVANRVLQTLAHTAHIFSMQHMFSAQAL